MSIVLSSLGFQIRLVDVPDSLDFLDVAFSAPDDQGGITVNTRVWCQGEGKSGDEAFPGLCAAFDVIHYLKHMEKDLNTAVGHGVTAECAI